MTKNEILSVAKPILFNTEMVRAILDGRKTQTRRVIKEPAVVHECTDGLFVTRPRQYSGEYCNFDPYCPIIKGDCLYVRETWAIWSPTEGTVPKFHYRADNETLRNVVWKPSIHMPKEAARIFLRVTDVSVEQLQDIDDDGFVAEGLEIGAPFDELWGSTIKKSERDKYGWNANPWVFVYKFEMVIPE